MKNIILVLSFIFVGCLSRATPDQCRKACFNQAAIQEQLNPKINWDGKVQVLKNAMQKSIAGLEKQKTTTVARLKQADKALAAAHQKDNPNQISQDRKKLEQQYMDLIEKVKKRYIGQMNEVKEAKLKAEIATKRRVEKEINACIQVCRKQKWDEKQAACVSSAKSPDNIRGCF